MAWSPDLEIEGDNSCHRPAKRNGRFAGEGFAENLNAAWSGTAIDDIDLIEGDVGKFLVVPENGGSGDEEADVEAIVAALAVEESDELIQAG